MRFSSSLLSLTIAGSLICSAVPMSAHAGNLGPEAQEDPALTEAKALYNEGKIKFELGEFEAALSMWKRAFAILPDGDDTRTMRHTLVYNIASAHSKAYEISRNPTHLRTAKVLLQDYRAAHLALYGDQPDAVKERAEVDDRIAELDKKIAASEAAGEVATPLSDGAATAPVGGGGTAQPAPPPPTKPLSPSQQWERDVKADPTLGPLWEKGGKQVGSGAVLVGIGGVFTLVGAVFVVWGIGLRQSTNDGLVDLDGTGALTAGAVFGVGGLGMLIPGAVVLGMGLQKRNEVKRLKPRYAGSFHPTLVPRGAGFGYTLRF